MSDRTGRPMTATLTPASALAAAAADGPMAPPPILEPISLEALLAKSRLNHSKHLIKQKRERAAAAVASVASPSPTPIRGKPLASPSPSAAGKPKAKVKIVLTHGRANRSRIDGDGSDSGGRGGARFGAIDDESAIDIEHDRHHPAIGAITAVATAFVAALSRAEDEKKIDAATAIAGAAGFGAIRSSVVTFSGAAPTVIGPSSTAVRPRLSLNYHHYEQQLLQSSSPLSNVLPATSVMPSIDERIVTASITKLFTPIDPQTVAFHSHMSYPTQSSQRAAEIAAHNAAAAEVLLFPASIIAAVNANASANPPQSTGDSSGSAPNPNAAISPALIAATNAATGVGAGRRISTTTGAPKRSSLLQRNSVAATPAAVAAAAAAASVYSSPLPTTRIPNEDSTLR